MKIIDTKPYSTTLEYHEIINIPLYKICKVKQIVNLSNYHNITFLGMFKGSCFQDHRSSLFLFVHFDGCQIFWGKR